MALEYVCVRCESASVTREAWVEWDAGTQNWILATIFEQAFCLACYRPTTLDGKPAVEPHSAR